MSLLATLTANRPVRDQARELRALVARRAICTRDASPDSIRTCRSLAVVSGKGGVGKSVLALNLAIALARRGASVCLLDASSSVGHLGLLCGQNGYWNLSHVAAGSRCLDDIVLDGPCGVRMIPGASNLIGGLHSRPAMLRELVNLECEHDWLIVDTAGGTPRGASPFAQAADRVVIVTTPEPTAVAEAYATLKSLAAADGPVASVLVNQADSEHQALEILDRLRHTARTFLRTDLDRAGFVPHDPSICQSVYARQPLVDVDASCPAQQAIERLAERFHCCVTSHDPSSYMERLRVAAAT
jgi:flagellar biosynthesis protein FlhG